MDVQPTHWQSDMHVARKHAYLDEQWINPSEFAELVPVGYILMY